MYDTYSHLHLNNKHVTLLLLFNCYNTRWHVLFQAPLPETPLQQLPSPENRGNFHLLLFQLFLGYWLNDVRNVVKLKLISPSLVINRLKLHLMKNKPNVQMWILPQLSVPDHNSNGAQHRMDPLVLLVAAVCGVALLLPTWQVDSSTLPPYLHLTIHQKLVVAYVLGLVTMVILHFWSPQQIEMSGQTTCRLVQLVTWYFGIFRIRSRQEEPVVISTHHIQEQFWAVLGPIGVSQFGLRSAKRKTIMRGQIYRD